jgi:hypothetical protein
MRNAAAIARREREERKRANEGRWGGEEKDVGKEVK